MSNCPGLYVDIGKRARDVLYRGYAQQPPLHFHYQWFDCSFDLSCLIEEIVPGLRTLFRLTIPDSAKVELRYMRDYVGISGAFGIIANPLTGISPILNFSGVMGSTFLSLGTDLGLDMSTRTLCKFNAGLSFNSDLLIASLTLNNKLDTLKVSCCHTVNPLTNTAIAAEVKHSFSINDTALSFGVQHALFPFTTVKARFNTYGKAGALIQQELWQKFVVTFAGEVDFMDIMRIPKIGLSMAFRA